MANQLSRIRAVEAYVQALKTGSLTAARVVSSHLAPDVALATGREDVQGYAQVLDRASGQWPLTPGYLLGSWSDPTLHGDALTVHAEFPDMGGIPPSMDLTFLFDAEDRIVHIDQRAGRSASPPLLDRLPLFVRGIVDSALANGTPMTVAYVGERDQPVLSLRGSVVVFNDYQLAIWVRNAAGGIVAAISRNSQLSLLYRDSSTRTTLVFNGLGHVEPDPAIRDRLYTMIPEVEQRHDPARQGAALVVDITEAQGRGSRGSFRMQAATGKKQE